MFLLLFLNTKYLNIILIIILLIRIIRNNITPILIYSEILGIFTYSCTLGILGMFFKTLVRIELSGNNIKDTKRNGTIKKITEIFDLKKNKSKVQRIFIINPIHKIIKISTLRFLFFSIEIKYETIK
jgi:hypothetical protein